MIRNVSHYNYWPVITIDCYTCTWPVKKNQMVLTSLQVLKPMWSHVNISENCCMKFNNHITKTKKTKIMLLETILIFKVITPTYFHVICRWWKMSNIKFGKVFVKAEHSVSEFLAATKTPCTHWQCLVWQFTHWLKHFREFYENNIWKSWTVKFVYQSLYTGQFEWIRLLSLLFLSIDPF